MNNRNHKSAILVKKIEDKYVKVKKYHCPYIGESRGAAHSIYKLKYSTPKKLP